jgi:lipopolysaccharide transport system ATP-binding protein
MSDVVIRAERLSKLYRIGQREKFTTLRDVISRTFTAPFRRWFKNNQNEIIPNHQPLTSDNYIWALKDVSFEVKQGEVVGIIGRNGAGKSTLLKILARITEPTEGYAEVRGRVGSLLEVGTGFHPELTGRENIYLSGAVLGMKKREIDRKFDEIVSFAEMEKFIDTPVKYYSSGMYVRLAFAVAAHLDPEILLVDEVLAVGDAAFQKKCLGKMGDVAKEGRTVLFVSHNMAAIENLCTRAFLLDNGRIIYSGDTRFVIQTYLQTMSQISYISLQNQSNRTGTGRVRFTHFYIEDINGRKLRTIQSGQDIVLVFGFKCKEGDNPQNVAFDFGIHAITGERLAVLHTDFVGQTFPKVPPKGEVRCYIPRFPFAPGRYIVYSRIEVNGIEADFPRDGTGYIDVEAGDFFGTGRIVDGQFAPFLISGKWWLKPLEDNEVI